MEKLTPRAVIFDLGSTLIEYESLAWSELMYKAYSSVWNFLNKQGYKVPDEESFKILFDELKADYRKNANETLVEWTVPQVVKKLIKRLEIQSDNGNLVDKIFEAYYKPVEKQLYIYDDTLATLKKVKEKGYVTGLISNTIFPEETHLKEIKRFGIEPYLNFTIFSSTFGVRKPHADIFYHAANQAGFAPAECVYIGDRYREDYEGPTSIDMPAVLKIHPDREYPAEMPETVRKITTLSELSEHIDI